MMPFSSSRMAFPFNLCPKAFLPIFLLFTAHLWPSFSLAELAAAPINEAATFPLQTRPFIVEPPEEPILVREGEPGPLLNCSVGEQFRERNRYELEWTKVVGDTPNLISRNGRLFAPAAPDGYELLDSVQQDGGYNLRLRGVQFQRDNGRFFCAHIDTETRQQTLSEPARIVVLVPPEPPQIIDQPAEAVREGDFVTIRCASSGGNPPPKFQWFFDNKSAVPENWFHDRVETGGKSISTLQMHVKREHNKSYLVCKIWNKAMENGQVLEAETMKLNVLYAPQVRIQPPMGEMNVEEGDTVPLICHADANPMPAQYQWTHVPSGQIHTEKEWHLAVRRNQAGEFRCTATNSIDSASEKIRLNVLYGPTVRIKVGGGGGGGNAGNAAISPAEGDRLVLDCEADANPKADAFAWTGPGGVRQNGSRLVLDSVNRAHSGNFTCSAWNTLAQLFSKPSAEQHQSSQQQTVIRTGLAQLSVDVRRKPGAALILAKRTVFNVGEPIALGCTTDGDSGSPVAKFKWAGPATRGVYGKEPDWLGAQLRVAEAKLTDNGLYKCAPYNEIGQGEEQTVRVMVVEPAHISRPLSPSHTLTSNQLNFQMECEARGFPQPRIVWLKDGQPLPIESSRLWSLREKISSTGCPQDEPCALAVRSTLQFQHPIGWADKGNYSCVAENSPSTALPVATSQLISVTHEPVILNAAFAPDGMALAAADLGTSSARIVCQVSANPPPKITWNRDGLAIGQGFEEDRRYKTWMNRVAGAIDEYESVLELDQVGERDFGTFVCEAKNGVGARKSAMEIRLQPKGHPQTPIHAKMLKSSLDWLLIGWRPGFDGGERQVFELEYRPVDPFTGRGAGLEMEPLEFTFGPSNWSSLAVFEADSDSAQPTTFLVHNLTQLRPQASFWYRLRARNARGVSDWTAIEKAGTEDAPDSGDIQSPESLLYLVDEQRLVVEPLKNSPAHCMLVYAASREDGNWRSVDCFSLANSDGIIQGIQPAERFKVRYCMANDVGKCSAGIKIFVENLPSANSIWMLAFIVGCVCVLSFSVLIALLCCRRRFQKATNHGRGPLHHSMQNGASKQPRKKLNLNGGVVMDSRIDKNGGCGTQLASNTKNTPVNGSQTDSGVFTLGSSSAMAATAVALNGMGGRTTGNLVGICAADQRRDSNANSGEWSHQNGGIGGGGMGLNPSGSPQHLSPHQLEAYDFSSDPFLQEFAAANALGGIVVVENSLHQNSSAESTPSCQQQQKSYSKFFNEFSAAFLGSNGTNGGSGGQNAGGKMMAPTINNRHSALMLPRRGENGGGIGNEEREPTGNSNEQLIASGEGSDTASSSGGFGGVGGTGGNGGGAGGGGRGASVGGRVMREIIV